MIMSGSGSYFSGRSGSYPLNQANKNNWQILSIHNGTTARLFKHFKDFKVNMYVVKDELDHFEEKCSKIRTE
jgi:hypothetical protein